MIYLVLMLYMGVSSRRSVSCTLVASGCGNSAGLVPVSGKVLYRGEPASGAVVYFQRQDSHPSAHVLVPSGVVKKDGEFSLASEGLGSGAPPGSYNRSLRASAVRASISDQMPSR